MVGRSGCFMLFIKAALIAAVAGICCTVMSGCSEKSAYTYNKEGMEFYEKGDYEQAEAYLEKAMSIDEDNTTYKQNYAMVLIQTGKSDEAIEILKGTITDKTSGREGKRNKYAYRGLGIAYLMTNDYESAISNFDAALAIDVESDWDTDILYYKGNATLLSGDTDSALSIYSAIIQTDPENADAYQSRAGIYRDTYQFEKAISDFESALDYEEGNFEIYIGLAACYMECGREADAEDVLFLASLLDIETEEDKFYLGVVHYYQEKFDAAQAEMEYALADGFDEAYFYLAEMSLMNGDTESALTYFESYIDNNVVKSPTVINDLAVCLISEGRYEEAYNWIEEGLAFNVSTVRDELLRNEIAALEGMGELATAKEKLGEYIADHPDDAGAAQEYEFLNSRVQ